MRPEKKRTSRRGFMYEKTERIVRPDERIAREKAGLREFLDHSFSDKMQDTSNRMNDVT